MSIFMIYKHSVLGHEVVKKGFSWPGFFFTWIWAFVKKLWVPGIVLLVVVFTFSSFGAFISQSGFLGGIIGLFLVLAPNLVVGEMGNTWREKSMVQRGYQLEGPVEAGTTDAALAKFIEQGITDDLPEEKHQKENSLRTPEPTAVILMNVIGAGLICITISYLNNFDKTSLIIGGGGILVSVIYAVFSVRKNKFILSH